MRNSISGAAASRRESSRETSGRFGEQEFARAQGIDLNGVGVDDDWMAVLDVDEVRAADAQERLDDASAGLVEQAQTEAATARDRERERAVSAEAERSAAERRARQAADEEERRRAEAKARRLAARPDPASPALREDDDEVFDQAFLDDLRAVAHRSKYSSQNFDADELVGEAALQILRAERSGQIREPSKIPRAYIDSVMHAHSTKEMSGRRSRDVTGYGKYAAALESEQIRRGRELTAGEQDALAETVRQSIETKNRPGVGYHRLSRAAVASLDDTTEEGQPKYDLAARGGDSYALAEYTSDDHAMLELAEQLEEEGDANPAYRSALQRRAWTVNASIVNRRDGSWRRPVPTPLSRQLPIRRVTTSLSQIRSSGGAVVVARRWLDGDRDSTNDALFLPFGSLSEQDRDAVADFLVEQSDEHGEDAANAMHTSAAGQARSDASDATTVEVDRMLGLHPQSGGAR